MAFRGIRLRIREILGIIQRVVDETTEHVVYGNDDVNLSLSKLVATKVITPECADFALGLQYGHDHFHLIQSQESVVRETGDLTALCGRRLCNEKNVVPIRIENNQGKDIFLVVGDIRNFDFSCFEAEFHLIAEIDNWVMQQDEEFSEGNIRVCHKEGFRKFFNAFPWPPF